MKNKGFTLIELLAVIVILAIIALIATPAVLNIIEDSRKSAAEASARNIINAAKTYYMSETMKGKSIGTVNLSAGTIKYGGQQADKGYVVFDDKGKSTGKMYINGYCIEVDKVNKLTSEKIEIDECEIDSIITYPTYVNGTALYFDTRYGVRCTEEEAKLNVEEAIGCMKFYTFLDNEGSKDVKLILDHNIEGSIKDYGWKVNVNGINTELTERLITEDEIYEIAPFDDGVARGRQSWYYYLHTGDTTIYEGQAGTNKYAWLFDNLYNCEMYGCNNEIAKKNTSYSTSGEDMDGETAALYLIITNDGAASWNYYGSDDTRPVIEISKSVFEFDNIDQISLENLKREDAEETALHIIDSAKLYYNESFEKGTTPGVIDLNSGLLSYEGVQATKGFVEFDNDGDASSKMYINGYCIEIDDNNTVTLTKTSKQNCNIEIPNISQTIAFPLKDGAEIYFNPVTGQRCQMIVDEETGTVGNCMKWYAFLDSEDSATVNLILDHNTTGKVAWNSNSSGTTPDTVNAKLQADITNWSDEVKSTARLISAQEVNQIAPADASHTWDINDRYTYYYLHNGLPAGTNANAYKGATGTNKYAWLFDNTNGCTTYGCNVADNGTNGYWTSSFDSSSRAWSVDYAGSLGAAAFYISYYGVRPVITVSKSIFE